MICICIENWSVGFDIKIMFLTIFKGFINKNAYQKGEKQIPNRKKQEDFYLFLRSSYRSVYR